jgi:hypothetical protein
MSRKISETIRMGAALMIGPGSFFYQKVAKGKMNKLEIPFIVLPSGG